MDGEVFAFRLKLIGLALVVVAAGVVVRLVAIQYGPDVPWLKEKARRMSEQAAEILPPRGQVMDRNGNWLAINDTRYTVSFSPQFVRQPRELADFLAEMLGRPESELFELASLDPEQTLYAPVPHPGVTSELAQQIEALGLEQGIDLAGLDLTPKPHRTYPAGSLAAHVLGFVAYNEAGRLTGYYGVEEYYNEILAGQPISAVKRLVPFDVELDPAPPGGQDLVLTIDRRLQFETERILADGLASTGAHSGMIIVMEPQTGEILAMASLPSFDPNDYASYANGLYTNPAVGAQYEPGSTFKVLTMAAALDSGTVAPETPFLDTGVVEVGGAIIHNWNYDAWGPQDMTGCLQYSLNVCLATVATWMGPKVFYDYMTAFGIGQTLSVDLAAESAGRLKQPGDPDWYDSDLGTNSFGQGVAVTPLQLLTAISAVANDGAMMQPHVLYQVINGDNVHTTRPQVLGRPIRPETAATLTEMLAVSLEREASGALVPGYRIAGKTGTAQIPIPGGYDPEATIASFVGWGPLPDPRFIVFIRLDRPTASPWGSQTAAPMFGELVKRLVVLMEIPPNQA